MSYAERLAATYGTEKDKYVSLSSFFFFFLYFLLYSSIPLVFFIYV